MTCTFNPAKLHQELLDAGLPATSVRIHDDSSCEPIFSRKLTAQEIKTADQVIDTHTPHTHTITPSKNILKGDDLDSVTFVVETDPELDAVYVNINGAMLNVPLVDGQGTFELLSDTPGDVLRITGHDADLPGAAASVYVI